MQPGANCRGVMTNRRGVVCPVPVRGVRQGAESRWERRLGASIDAATQAGRERAPEHQPNSSRSVSAAVMGIRGDSPRGAIAASERPSPGRGAPGTPLLQRARLDLAPAAAAPAADASPAV